jgi:hypothetical protein
MFGKKTTRILTPFTLLAAGLPLFAEEPTPERRDDCLKVELMMYSGRERPQYFICEEVEKQNVLSRFKVKKGEGLDVSAFPEMESSPAYQGILLTLPKERGEKPRRVLLRKGFFKSDEDSSIGKDEGGALEISLLNRSLGEKDASQSPTQGKSLEAISRKILDKVKQENAAK